MTEEEQKFVTLMFKDHEHHIKYLKDVHKIEIEHARLKWLITGFVLGLLITEIFF